MPNLDTSSWLEETVRHSVTTLAMRNGLSSSALGSKPEILDPFLARGEPSARRTTEIAGRDQCEKKCARGDCIRWIQR
jgi:hypothetical protein